MTKPPLGNKTISWEPPPQHLTLPSNHVHIWKADISPSQKTCHHCEKLLSADEHARARQFKFPQHQQAFITARGILRLILSRYLNTPPQSLIFEQGPHGKPALTFPSAPSISFNVSHSHHLALYAVTLENDVGIDIEYHRSTLNLPGLIQRICSTQEKSILASLSPVEQKKGFFTCWTQKEAYVKAIGKGITIPLETITVSLPRSNSIELGELGNKNQEVSMWSLSEIAVDSDYSAALAIKDMNCRCRYWEWSLDKHE